MYSFFSDIVIVLHFLYVVFALVGGVLMLWWRKIVWLHLPSALWAAFISFVGWVCPLTFLENWLRIKGGETGYSEGFIAKYIEPILYPAGLTHWHQVVLGIIVIGLNLAIYSYIFRSNIRQRRVVC